MCNKVVAIYWILALCFEFHFKARRGRKHVNNLNSYVLSKLSNCEHLEVWVQLSRLPSVLEESLVVGVISPLVREQLLNKGSKKILWTGLMAKIVSVLPILVWGSFHASMFLTHSPLCCLVKHSFSKARKFQNVNFLHKRRMAKPHAVIEYIWFHHSCVRGSMNFLSSCWIYNWFIVVGMEKLPKRTTLKNTCLGWL